MLGYETPSKRRSPRADIIPEAEKCRRAGITGREHILFLDGSYDLSVEAWEVIGTWDVQRREDGTVIAVHPFRDLWRSFKPDGYQAHRSKLEMELPAFTQALTEAHQARVTEYGGRIGADESLPMLVTDANRLREYYTAVGAYDHPDGPPEQPPPPCGLAVPDQANSPGLMRDCINLLAAKDALRGTATLNWSVDTTIAAWNGINITGSPKRVTRLDLSARSLTGTIPPQLGDLTALETLSLDNNRLTGEVPAALGRLGSLRFLYLYKNRLTGEVPAELGNLANLHTLWLFNNELTGNIPSELGDLTNLERLALDHNRLTGSIPGELGSLANLESLRLDSNRLTGAIPPEMGDLSNLETLMLAGNDLTGCVPPALREVDDNDLDSLGLQDCAASE